MRYVIGYASLLSEVSIRRLFPNVGNIIPVEIDGHARCFNSYGTLSVIKGLTNRNRQNLAHAAAILRPNFKIHALAFELDDCDYKTYEKHEFRYSLCEVDALCIETHEEIRAIICYENTDHLINTKLVGSDSIYELYDRFETHTFWHANLLPADIYLSHCIASARILGKDVVDNFLDTSFIHDREMSIRQYLKTIEVDVEIYVRAAKLSDVF